MINQPKLSGEPGQAQQLLLVRRNDATGVLAYHLCHAPRPTAMRTLVRVAGQRWRIEENSQAAKGLVGLDQHQVRRWDSWHRWTTLAMLAHAFLTVLATVERAAAERQPGLIAITVAEARRLFNALTAVVTRTATDILAWSTWRRRHQAGARTAHYHRRFTAGQDHDRWL